MDVCVTWSVGGGPERHADGPQYVAATSPVTPVHSRPVSHAACVAERTVRVEGTTAVVPEASTVPSGTIAVRIDIVVLVGS